MKEETPAFCKSKDATRPEKSVISVRQLHIHLDRLWDCHNDIFMPLAKAVETSSHRLTRRLANHDIMLTDMGVSTREIWEKTMSPVIQHQYCHICFEEMCWLGERSLSPITVEEYWSQIMCLCLKDDASSTLEGGCLAPYRPKCENALHTIPEKCMSWGSEYYGTTGSSSLYPYRIILLTQVLICEIELGSWSLVQVSDIQVFIWTPTPKSAVNEENTVNKRCVKRR